MKKAILYIDSMQKGGAQRVMSVLGSYLCDNGVETILVNDIKSVNDEKEYTIDSRICRYFLDSNLNKRIIKNIYRVITIRKIIKKENPDVVLSFMGPPNYRMLVATLGLHVRKVVSVRNDPYKEYGQNILQKTLAGLLFQFADGCVFQTDMASQYFPEHVRKKSNIILNPVDPTFFDTEWKEINNTIITVGRLYPQKNQALLLKAFSRVHKSMPDVKLKICGKGVEEQKLKRLAKELEIEYCVNFLGEISDVKDELKRSSCFVLSSDYEGLPNALMEAMAVGMPVISTDCPCGGPRMLIKQYENGVLVTRNNENELAEAIIRVMSDMNERKRLGRQAKQSSKLFSTNVVMKKWYDYLFLEEKCNV